MSGYYDSSYANTANQYSSYGQYQSTYPSSGFSQPQFHVQQDYNAYGNNQNNYSYQQQPANQSYYESTPMTDAQRHNDYQPNADVAADRGLMGAMAGGATGAFAGHKARGHGVMGAIGGAILGSLAEDYAKKGKKNKKGHNNDKKSSPSSNALSNFSNNSSSMGGLGSVASGFFNSKHSSK